MRYLAFIVASVAFSVHKRAKNKSRKEVRIFSQYILYPTTTRFSSFLISSFNSLSFSCLFSSAKKHQRSRERMTFAKKFFHLRQSSCRPVHSIFQNTWRLSRKRDNHRFNQMLIKLQIVNRGRVIRNFEFARSHIQFLTQKLPPCPSFHVDLPTQIMG